MNTLIRWILGITILCLVLFGGASYIMRTALESITKHQAELDREEFR